MDVNFKVSGLRQMITGLEQIKLRYQNEATQAAAVYLIGNDSRGLKHEPAYKYVSRKSAYGQTFVSAKQRRYVMAMIRSGKITPGTENRTHAIRDGWQLRYSGLGVRIVNSAKGVGWVMGKSQARQPAKVGWRSYEKIAADNTAGMSRASSQAVQALIRSNLSRGGG